METQVTHPCPTNVFTIGDRTYELISFLKEGESSVSDNTMAERAKKLDANLGQKDGQFILERQDKIPEKFRMKFCLVFADWRNSLRPQCVTRLIWDRHHWCAYWLWHGNDWGVRDRLVCRIA